MLEKFNQACKTSFVLQKNITQIHMNDLSVLWKDIKEKK